MFQIKSDINDYIDIQFIAFSGIEYKTQQKYEKLNTCIWFAVSFFVQFEVTGKSSFSWKFHVLSGNRFVMIKGRSGWMQV